MASKIVFIFLVALTAGISFADDVKLKNIKKNKPKTNKKEVSENISKLADLVTLMKTKTQWGQPNFHDCLNQQSHYFIFPEVRFAYDLLPLLNNFKSNTMNEKIQSLADKIGGHINANFNLMEGARRSISIRTKRHNQTKKSDEHEKLVKELKDIKEKLISNFHSIDKNFREIQSADNQSYKAELANIERTYKEKIENLKQAAKKYVEEIRKCLTG